MPPAQSDFLTFAIPAVAAIATVTAAVATITAISIAAAVGVTTPVAISIAVPIAKTAAIAARTAVRTDLAARRGRALAHRVAHIGAGFWGRRLHWALGAVLGRGTLRAALALWRACGAELCTAFRGRGFLGILRRALRALRALGAGEPDRGAAELALRGTFALLTPTARAVGKFLRTANAFFDRNFQWNN